MNIFVFLDKGNDQQELVTPPLDKGIILPGVTRRSIIELTREWGKFEINEREITMNEVKTYVCLCSVHTHLHIVTFCFIVPLYHSAVTAS